MQNKYVFIIIISLMILCNCGLSSKYNYKVLKTSTMKRPEWVDVKYKESKDIYYFSESKKIKKNEILGLRLAKNKLITVIENKIEVVLIEFLDEKINNSEIDMVYNDYINKLIGLMEIKKIIPDATYYEKREENEQEYFCCYVYKMIKKNVLKNNIYEILDILKKENSKNKKSLIILNKIKK